jgi:hypothetical protein
MVTSAVKKPGRQVPAIRLSIGTEYPPLTDNINRYPLVLRSPLIVTMVDPQLSNLSPQATVALTFINYINTKDWERFDGILADDFVQQVLPLSLKRPLVQKQAYITHMKLYMDKLLPDFKVDINILSSPTL